MEKLLDIIIECNKNGRAKMESSLRAFHWFFVEQYLSYDKSNNIVLMHRTADESDDKRFKLILGETEYSLHNSVGERGNCDGVFEIGEEKVMVEIKTTFLPDKCDEYAEQMKTYIENMKNRNSKYNKLVI